MYTVFLYIFAAIGVIFTGCFALFFIMLLCSIIYEKRHPGWLNIPDDFETEEFDK